MLVVLAGSVLWSGPAVSVTSAGEAASATCEAHAVGDRVVAAITLHGFVEDESLRLLRLGMRGRIRVEATLLRKRWGVFEQTIASRVMESDLSSSRDKRALILNDGTPVDPLGPIPLTRLALRLPERDVGRTTLRVAVQLQVLTMSSLSKVAAWATESGDEDGTSSILTRGLLAAVVKDLTRSAECACAVAAPDPAEPRRR
jgi:hypothetical protein